MIRCRPDGRDELGRARGDGDLVRVDRGGVVDREEDMMEWVSQWVSRDILMIWAGLMSGFGLSLVGARPRRTKAVVVYLLVAVGLYVFGKAMP
jgi:hypothetical protein